MHDPQQAALQEQPAQPGRGSHAGTELDSTGRASDVIHSVPRQDPWDQQGEVWEVVPGISAWRGSYGTEGQCRTEDTASFTEGLH